MKTRRRKKRETQSGQRDDVGLFAQFLSGDDAAFRTFFERHNQKLYAYCFKMTRSHRHAEDLVQEAWIRAIDLRAKAVEPVGNPVGLMVRIVRNLCLDFFKSGKNLQPLDELGENQHPVYRMEEKSTEEEIVQRSLERLSFNYREVLVLNVYSGYSCEDIASMLDASPDAIWARVSRARKKLRELVVRELEREESGLKVLTQSKRKTR